MFSYKFCKIFKKTFLTEYLQRTSEETHLESCQTSMLELFPDIVNFFMTEVPIIQKQVHGFALQTSGLLSIW